MSEEVKQREWKEQQATRDRQVRMNDIQEKAREADRLSRMIQNLDASIKRIQSGEGFFKAQASISQQWASFAGLDGRDDEREIRRLIVAYAHEKMQKAEAEFDKL